MIKLSKCALLAASIGAPLSPGVSAAAATRVEQATASTLEESVRATKEGLAVHSVFTDPLANALIVRRDRSGEVERHAAMNDIFVARSGRVTILLGGSIEGGREVSPGEWRGGRIVGGETRTLSPGDMMWIPIGIPHQMILAPKASFTYIAIKVPAR